MAQIDELEKARDHERLHSADKKVDHPEVHRPEEYCAGKRVLHHPMLYADMDEVDAAIRQQERVEWIREEKVCEEASELFKKQALHLSSLQLRPASEANLQVSAMERIMALPKEEMALAAAQHLQKLHRDFTVANSAAEKRLSANDGSTVPLFHGTFAKTLEVQGWVQLPQHSANKETQATATKNFSWAYPAPGARSLPEIAQLLGFNHCQAVDVNGKNIFCLLYTSPSPRDGLLSRMPSSA